MGIIDDYLKPDDSKKSAPEKASGLIEQYLGDTQVTPTGRLYVSPAKAPISGFSKEESDYLNSQPGQQGGVNPRSQESYAGRAAGAVYDAAKSGILTAGQGASDVLSNKPATGIGEIGSGILSTLTSPLAAVNQVAGDVTGSKDIADRAGFVAGTALPVVPGASAVNKSLPKNRALSELVDKITSNGREPEKLVEVVQAMKANPRIAPADLSPAVQNMAQKLFTTEGDAAKNYLHTASTNRIKSSAGTVNEAYDAAAGLPVNAVNKLKDLSDAAKKVGDIQINPAIAGASPVNITPVIEHIDEILKPGVMSKITGESSLPFPKVKQALENVKGMIANDKEQLTSPQALHNFQSALRREAEARLGSADGEQRQLGAALMAVRNKVVNAIDEASPKASAPLENGKIRFYHGHSPNADPTSYAAWVSNKEDYARNYRGGKNEVSYVDLTKDQAKKAGLWDDINDRVRTTAQLSEDISKKLKPLENSGTYKPALNNYRSEKEIGEAFHDAYNGVLTNSKKLENRPEFTKEWFDGLTAHEKQAAIEGIRTRIDTEIGVAKNPALAGTSLGKSSFNQKKMEAVLGKEETKKLLDTLEAERAISNTHNKIVEGSQTEMRHAADSAIALPVKGESKGLAKYVIPALTTGAEIGGTMAGLPTGIGGALGLGASVIGAGVAKGGSAASFAVRTALAKERNMQLAKYALPTEGPSRDELIKSLEAAIPGPKKSLLTKASGLARIVAP